jgi:ABC-type multidrug transport system permease subunit
MTVDERVTTLRTLPAHVRPWWSLSRHAVVAFFRNPMAAFFTIAFPLAFLVIVASIIGGEDTPDGVPVAQFLIAPFAVFGVAEAAFSVLAVDTAVLRENGMLLRLRGSPVSAATVLAARITASVVASVAAVLLLTGVGVAAYGVEIVWRKVPALFLTLVLGIACLAALGLAVTSLTRTVLAAQTLTQGLLIPLAFISDVFIVGANLPPVLAVTGSALPLKHFARAMAETFHPGSGLGFSPGHLAVLAGWAVAGAAVAVWRFGWSPRGSASTSRPATLVGAAATPALSAPREAGRPSTAALLAGQIRYALLGLRRDLLSVFFAVVFPALLLVLFPSVFGSTTVHGLTMAQYLLAGMMTYAVAVAGYVNLPESVANARAQGALRRLRGTPLPSAILVVGRVISALVVGLLSAGLLCVVAVAGLDVQLDPARLPAVLLGVVLGVSCFAALGLAVVALMRSARSVIAVTLGTLLPLSFVSEVFVVGEAAMPPWLSTIADLFPLRHLMEVMLTATRPGVDGLGVAWAHVAVVAGWTLAALAVLAVHARRTAAD